MPHFPHEYQTTHGLDCRECAESYHIAKQALVNSKGSLSVQSNYLKDQHGTTHSATVWAVRPGNES